ncbi:MAG: quinone-dependent dihydroorotate dehydrogenase [Proteobacteria bacterium]|nr:quinone-dependent dihydroorotate dehydrogenase [Cystobacterineae bacterium]MCL2258320.1 quinone-dependent dihydroorotate dehydrogenase [Cystobacterineae bacterium]MCL2314175.1 quinone-dependent dihydroorotate dehydrogenase [Pseudomonadota bacterium]
MSYWRWIRPLLFSLPAEFAHNLGMRALYMLGVAKPLAHYWHQKNRPLRPRLASHLFGLPFPNPLGLAAGLDKNATAIAGLSTLGFGFIEVGTLTPKPQPGNPKPRLFRLAQHGAIINRMGFNNQGAERAARRLAKLKYRPVPVGINLGKNKWTALENAAEDYVVAAQTLAPFADYLAINLSSPNTPGLRSLQSPKTLEALLLQLKKLDTPKPLLVKLAPDLLEEELREISEVLLSCAVDGIIATNTTLQRNVSHKLASQTGGLSGKPLRALSNRCIGQIYGATRGRIPIVGVGGVFSAEDAYEKIKAGASLIQMYSGFIYGGPGSARRILDGLEACLLREGVKHLSEVVGQQK